MAVHGLINAKQVIAKVFSDFKPQDEDFEFEALEWIGDAMGLIGAGPQYIDKDEYLEVSNYKAFLPCDLSYIKQIGHVIKHEDNKDQITKYHIVPMIPSTSTASVGGDRANPSKDYNPYYSNHQYRYQLNGNVINTELENGLIVMYYKGFPVDDEEGYPMVPDNSAYKEALHWFIIMKLMESGLRHPVIGFGDAEKRWMSYAKQARANVLYPSIDDYESFARGWTNLINGIKHHDTFFRGLNDRGDYNYINKGKYGNQSFS
jgi:hypothetical protein